MDTDKNPMIPEPDNDVQFNGQPSVRNTSLDTSTVESVQGTRLDIAPADIEAPTVFDHSGETTLDQAQQSPSSQAVPPVPTPAQGDPLRSPVAPVAVTPSLSADEQSSGSVFAPAPSTPPKKPLKKGLLAIILAGALVVLGGGSTLAYNMWYQNPDKVVTDSIINVIRAKSVTASGTLTMTSKDFDISVAMDTGMSDVSASGSADVTLTIKTDALKGEKLAVKGSYVMSPEGDFYVRVDKLAALVDTVVDGMLDMQVEMYSDFGVAMTESEIAEMREEAMDSITPIVKNIDSQWIKFSAEDIKEGTDNSAETTCYQDVVKRLQDEKSISKEIYTKYTENRFVTIEEELGSKDGSLGYVLGFDKDAAKSFEKAMEGTEIYKELEKCGDEGKADSTTDGIEALESKADIDMSNARVELWVDRFSHKITGLVVAGDNGEEGDDKVTANLNLTTVFDSKVTVDIPENAKSFKEVEKDIEGLTGAGGI